VKFKDPNCVRTVLDTKPHNLDGRNVRTDNSILSNHDDNCITYKCSFNDIQSQKPLFSWHAGLNKCYLFILTDRPKALYA